MFESRKESTVRLRSYWLSLALGVGLAFAHVAGAQQSTPAPGTTPTPPQGAPAPQTSPGAPPAAPKSPAQPGIAKPLPEAPDPSRTDQTYSLEFDYWLANGLPTLRGGAAYDVAGNSVLDYPGKSTDGLGAQVVIPLPSRSDIRISAFQVHGNGTATLTAIPSSYFTTGFLTGDFLSPSYTLDNVRISYEYFSLPWPPETRKWRLYTLYEVQYTNVKTVIDAPFKANVDSNGNAVETTATGSHDIVYPTFGLKVEYPVTKSFRLEAETSGFGIPKHAGQWDADVTAALRIHRHFELRVGEKAFYYKTSPKGEEYFSQLVYGVYGGLRFYLK